VLNIQSTVFKTSGNGGYLIKRPFGQISVNIRSWITVVQAPESGCLHPKHVELPTEI